MMKKFKMLLVLSTSAVIGFVALLPSEAMAQRGRGGGGGGGGARPSMGGGGGARPSMGMGGGGGARPSMGMGGGGGARPSMGMTGGGGARPSMGMAGGGARPSMPTQRPNMPNMSRPASPSLGNANARPSMPNTRPSMPNLGGGIGAGGSSIGANRPSLGGAGNLSNMSRPATLPGASRPTTLPSLGGGTNRPNLGSGMAASRPDGGNRPSLGNVNRPATLPGSGIERPNLGGNRPTTLPGTLPGTGAGTLPGVAGNRPATLPGTLPGGGERPGLGANRPGAGGGIPGVGGNRPVTLPGTLPGGGERPGLGANRPGAGGGLPGVGGNRPVTLPGGVERPGIGGNLPGTGSNRPNIGGNRPGIGGNRPGGNINLPGSGNNNNVVINRPGINVGGGNNIGSGGNNIGGGTNIGNNTGFNPGNRYPNRPNWNNDPGWNRPAYGNNGGWNNNGYNNWNDNGYNNWNNNWQNNWSNNVCNRHPWYNGAWNGSYGSSWVAPVMVGWGLNSLMTGWGTSVAYFNPYASAPIVGQSVPYDFSQPVVVNNYISSDASVAPDASVTPGAIGTASAPSAQPANSDNQLGLDAFDRGLEKFKAASFQEALTELNLALKKIPGDPIVHEVRALTLFAIGDFKSAAANLNSLLASSPGMDWTTMSGLYGDSALYTEQLRKLEAFTKANPSDPASHFVLAYHYLVLDEDEAAIDALKIVLANQPKDVVAQRMLDAIVPPASAQASAPATPPTASAPAPTASTPKVATSEPIASAAKPATGATAPAATSAPATEGAAEPETDLVGSWVAQANDTKIQLAISEDSKFKWTATTKDQPPVVLEGMLISHSDGLELTNPEKGTIAGGVTSNGENSWNFAISGSPPSDPGLKFTRVK